MLFLILIFLGKDLMILNKLGFEQQKIFDGIHLEGSKLTFAVWNDRGRLVFESGGALATTTASLTSGTRFKALLVGLFSLRSRCPCLSRPRAGLRRPHPFQQVAYFPSLSVRSV